MKFIQVITTTDNMEEAEKISSALVEKKLSACVQIIGPITSTYWWEEKIETSQEYLLFIKTEEGLYREVEEAIKELHSYQVPEIVALPVIAGSEDYLKWIKEVVGRK